MTRKRATHLSLVDSAWSGPSPDHHHHHEADELEPIRAALENLNTAQAAIQQRRQKESRRKQYPHISDIRMLLDLKPGWWKGEDYPTPNEVAIAKAATVVSCSLEATEQRPPRVTPSVEGGVTLYYSGTEGRYVVLECDNDGDILLSYSRRNGEIPPVFEVSLREVVAARIWGEISNFLNGVVNEVSLG